MPSPVLKEFSRHHPVQKQTQKFRFIFNYTEILRTMFGILTSQWAITPCPNLLKQCATRPEKKDGKLIIGQEKPQSLRL